jgi:hypothetical protein
MTTVHPRLHKLSPVIALSKRHYKWLVLVGTAMVALGPAIRDAARSDAEKYNELIDQTFEFERFDEALNFIRTSTFIRLERIEADVEPKDSTVRNPNAQLPSQINRTLDNAELSISSATRTVEQNDFLITRLGLHVPESKAKNESIRKQLAVAIEEINEVNNAINDEAKTAIKNGGPPIQTTVETLANRAAVDSSRVSSDAVVLSNELYKDGINRKRYVNTGDSALSIVGSVVFSLGLVLIVGAQWLARPGKAPELKL